MEITVITGFGVFKDAQGNIISKAELPEGKHPMGDEYTYEEVNGKAELDALSVYNKPLTTEEAQEVLIKEEIDKKLRDDAIASLKQKGDLPTDFVDKKVK